MRTVTIAVQALVRVAGLIQVTLGVLFWTGRATQLIGVHMLVGIVLVLALWTMAALAARAGTPPALWLLALGWGLLTVALGLTQTRLLPGSAHWLIQVLHLLVGLGTIGQAEALARRIKARIGVRPAQTSTPRLG